MKIAKVTLQDFATWLRSQSDDASYPFPPSCNCPIAKWTGKEVGCYSIGDDDAPEWAAAYIDAFDKQQAKTQSSALVALEVVEREFLAN